MGGEAKGFVLLVPQGRLTRPTQVLLRRRLFDFRQNWDEWCFIDLCAGVGTIGLEAWSRGASLVKLVESSFKVYRYLQKNTEKLVLSHAEEICNRPVHLFAGKAKDFLNEELERLIGKKNCWFFDPPYNAKELYDSVFSKVMDRMGNEDELWVQTGEGSIFQTESNPIKSFIQGNNRLDCYQKER